MDEALSPFTPILLFAGVLVLFVVFAIAFAHWIAPHRPRPVKDMPYECGMDPIGDARRQFDVKFYLIALLFILFDVELLYLYPWALVMHSQVGELRALAFWGGLAFIGLLLVGYIYEWRRGGFRWR
ncbi:MAG: NADH-quinone oxidoreductase subunit J [Gemmataceae bacterium]